MKKNTWTKMTTSISKKKTISNFDCMKRRSKLESNKYHQRVRIKVMLGKKQAYFGGITAGKGCLSPSEEFRGPVWERDARGPAACGPAACGPGAGRLDGEPHLTQHLKFTFLLPAKLGIRDPGFIFTSRPGESFLGCVYNTSADSCCT